MFDSVGKAAVVKNSGVGAFKGQLTTLITMTRVWFPHEDDQTKDFKRVGGVVWCSFVVGVVLNVSVSRF